MGRIRTAAAVLAVVAFAALPVAAAGAGNAAAATTTTATTTTNAAAAIKSTDAKVQPRSSVRAGGSAFSEVANPKRNASPAPDYNAPCWDGGAKGAPDTTACHVQQLAAINHQHALEHISPITLPRGFWSLRVPLQTFVITNLERVSRGLHPVTGVNPQMSSWAAAGARHSSDPVVAAWDLRNGTRLQTFGAIWASDLNALDADFIWMYADGWARNGAGNVDCVSATSTGCWGHRQIILGRFGGSRALVAGVADVAHHDADGALNSDAEAIASYTGPKPRLSYTWARAVAAGAR